MTGSNETQYVAPYVPFPAVRAALAFLIRDGQELPRVTADDLEGLDAVSESLAPRLLVAMKLLGFVDEGGDIEPVVDQLKRETREQRWTTIGRHLKTGIYAPVFEQFGDIAAADTDDVYEFFRTTYVPSSVTPRMVRLFYGLCKLARLVPAIPQFPSRPDRTSRPVPAREPSSSVAGQSSRLPDLILALVAKLPAKDEPWTQDGVDWWLEMMRMALPREYELDRPAGEQ